jgi:hypothetical protein
LRIWPILDGEAIDYEIDVWQIATDGVVDLGIWDAGDDAWVRAGDQTGLGTQKTEN